MQNNRRYIKQNIFHSAGWLFADLLLALTLIFIATSAKGKPLPQIPTPTPAAIVTPTLTPTQPPLALDLHPFTFTMTATPSQLIVDELHSNDTYINSLKEQVIQKLNQNNYGNRKVGFVITLAGGEVGEANAANFNDNILKSISAFKGAAFKNYLYLHRPQNEFHLEIYFFM